VADMEASPKYSLVDMKQSDEADELRKSKLKYHPFDLENDDSDQFNTEGLDYGRQVTP